MVQSFEKLVAEGEAVPVEGWDFSWFDSRATEARPSWGYARLIGQRMAQARAGLDVQTGGGEVLASIPTPPPLLVATESWPPNLALAAARLGRLGGTVLEAADDGPLPFADGTFDLVVSRHPTVVRWDEIARVLAPGGAYLSQQVGAGTVRELTDFMMGPQPVSDSRSTGRARRAATAAGLEIVRLRAESLPMTFDDVAAVIVFLRKVIWTVPGFTLAGYLPRLRAMHERIRSDGPFHATSQRFLIEADRPGGG